MLRLAAVLCEERDVGDGWVRKAMTAVRRMSVERTRPDQA